MIKHQLKKKKVLDEGRGLKKLNEAIHRLFSAYYRSSSIALLPDDRMRIFIVKHTCASSVPRTVLAGHQGNTVPAFEDSCYPTWGGQVEKGNAQMKEGAVEAGKDMVEAKKKKNE